MTHTSSGKAWVVRNPEGALVSVNIGRVDEASMEREWGPGFTVSLEDVSRGHEHVQELCGETGWTVEEAWEFIETLPYSAIPTADDTLTVLRWLRQRGGLPPWKRECAPSSDPCGDCSDCDWERR